MLYNKYLDYLLKGIMSSLSLPFTVPSSLLRLWNQRNEEYLNRYCGSSCMELEAHFVHRKDIVWVSHGRVK
jgi:hypothetical protein